MLAELQLRNFRCFESLRAEMGPGFNFFLGRNGQGKTSILEAACVLLRLQSQRSSTLAPAVRFGENAFGLAGQFGNHRVEFRYSTLRRKVSLDSVEQRTFGEYLRFARRGFFRQYRHRAGSRQFGSARVISISGSQIDASYRPTLRAYERASFAQRSS